MAKIFAKNKKYNGAVAGVQFINGVGETSDSYLMNYFTEKGYQLVEDKEKDISKMTVPELKELAKSKEIAGYENMKKDELLEALKG